MAPPDPIPAARLLHRSLLPAALAVSLALPGCGKKGPPRAPLRIVPAAARDVRVRQIGGAVVVAAQLPGTLTDGAPLLAGSAARVLRMRATATLTPGAVSPRYLARQFEKEARVLATLGDDALPPATPGRPLLFRDRDARAAAPPRDGARGRGSGPPLFLYAIQIVDSEGRRSDLSPPVAIEIVDPPPAPAGLKAETAEGEVRLAWEEGAPAAEDYLYNVYRRQAGQEADVGAPINPEPLAEPRHLDRGFRYGETYFYSVRRLASRAPPLRESEGAAEVEVAPRDVYPPRQPTGLAVAVEGRVIKLYWFPSEEADLAGYRVYRRRGPAAEFVLLGEAGAAEPSFVDQTAAPGVRYDYAVAAIDSASPPNESARSQEQSETLPVDTPEEAPAAPGGRR